MSEFAKKKKKADNPVDNALAVVKWLGNGVNSFCNGVDFNKIPNAVEKKQNEKDLNEMVRGTYAPSLYTDAIQNIILNSIKK